MKIVGFSYTTPPFDYDFSPHIQQEDDWTATRAPVTTPLAGAGGVFDFYDDDPFPVSPLVVTVPFTIVEASYNAVETELDSIREWTIAIGRSRLWGLPRGGSLGTPGDLRWIWAKCISGPGTPEKVSEQNFVKASVELQFYCPEGLWYRGIPISYSQSLSSGSNNFNLTNNGNQPPLCYWRATPTGSMTQFKVTNNTNGAEFDFTGTVASGNLLEVNAKIYNCANNAVDAYSDLTVASGQVPWMWLNPGSNSMTVFLAGSGATVTLYESYSTYVY